MLLLRSIEMAFNSDIQVICIIKLVMRPKKRSNDNDLQPRRSAPREEPFQRMLSGQPMYEACCGQYPTIDGVIRQRLLENYPELKKRSVSCRLGCKCRVR